MVNVANGAGEHAPPRPLLQRNLTIINAHLERPRKEITYDESNGYSIYHLSGAMSQRYSSADVFFIFECSWKPCLLSKHGSPEDSYVVPI